MQIYKSVHGSVSKAPSTKAMAGAPSPAANHGKSTPSTKPASGKPTNTTPTSALKPSKYAAATKSASPPATKGEPKPGALTVLSTPKKKEVLLPLTSKGDRMTLDDAKKAFVPLHPHRFLAQPEQSTAHKKSPSRMKYSDTKAKKTPDTDAKATTASPTTAKERILNMMHIGRKTPDDHRTISMASLTAHSHVVPAEVVIPSSIVDRGANGGIAGRDLRAISYAFPRRTVRTTALHDHEVGNLTIGTFGGVCLTTRGPIIAIFHQYAHHPTGSTIHSSLQLEHNGTIVDDRPSTAGGHQLLHTQCDHDIPLQFQHGHAQLNLRPFTDDEWTTLPHAHMTCDEPWDPSAYDSASPNFDVWRDVFQAEIDISHAFDAARTRLWQPRAVPIDGLDIALHGTNYAFLVRPKLSPHGTFIRHRARLVYDARNASNGRDATQHSPVDDLARLPGVTLRHYVDDILATFDLTPPDPMRLPIPDDDESSDDDSDSPPPLEEASPPASPKTHADFFMSQQPISFETIRQNVDDATSSFHALHHGAEYPHWFDA
jgi:hypothetical protein